MLVRREEGGPRDLRQRDRSRPAAGPGKRSRLHDHRRQRNRALGKLLPSRGGGHSILFIPLVMTVQERSATRSGGGGFLSAPLASGQLEAWGGSGPWTMADGLRENADHTPTSWSPVCASTRWATQSRPRAAVAPSSGLLRGFAGAPRPRVLSPTNLAGPERIIVPADPRARTPETGDVLCGMRKLNANSNHSHILSDELSESATKD